MHDAHRPDLQFLNRLYRPERLGHLLVAFPEILLSDQRDRLMGLRQPVVRLNGDIEQKVIHSAVVALVSVI